MRPADRRAIELGIPGLVLMENAALGVDTLADVSTVERGGVVCGPGNNGGDGSGAWSPRAARRRRARRFRAEFSADCASQLAICRALGIECEGSSQRRAAAAAGVAGLTAVGTGLARRSRATRYGCRCARPRSPCPAVGRPAERPRRRLSDRPLPTGRADRRLAAPKPARPGAGDQASAATSWSPNLRPRPRGGRAPEPLHLLLGEEVAGWLSGAAATPTKGVRSSCWWPDRAAWPVTAVLAARAVPRWCRPDHGRDAGRAAASQRSPPPRRAMAIGLPAGGDRRRAVEPLLAAAAAAAQW
jgi:hypothetical protein